MDMDRRKAIALLSGLAASAFFLTRPSRMPAVPTVKQFSAQPVTYLALARQVALANGLDPVTFVRQINQESGFNPAALSPAGAIGIAQFMPATASGLGFDPHDPVASLHAAARLMASYVHEYSGSYALALAAYNAGPATVSYALWKGGSAHWQAWVPLETQHYISVILD